MNLQTTSAVVMIEPTRFGFNEETYGTNSFQNKPTELGSNDVQKLALTEFRGFVKQLENVGVNVHVLKDVLNSETPDSIFPNNWFSTHRSGDIILYPMAVVNRRKERRNVLIEELCSTYGYQITDYTSSENQDHYLEGTGSLIFDHQVRTVYAAESPRTHLELVSKVGKHLGYEPITFRSFGKEGELIYHTNVMMCVGRTFVAIGLDTIHEADRDKVEESIHESKKELIPLSNDQIYHHFTGNMLQLENQQGETVLVLSETAYNSLSDEQLQQFSAHNDHLLPVAIPTIEHIGGGSARCMLAELFIPKN